MAPSAWGSWPPHLPVRCQGGQERGAPCRVAENSSLSLPPGSRGAAPAAAPARRGCTLRLDARAPSLPAPPAARPGPGGAAAGAAVRPGRAPGREPPPRGIGRAALDHQGQPLPESPARSDTGSRREPVPRSAAAALASPLCARLRRRPPGPSEGQSWGHAGARAVAAGAAGRLSPSAHCP